RNKEVAGLAGLESDLIISSIIRAGSHGFPEALPHFDAGSGQGFPGAIGDFSEERPGRRHGLADSCLAHPLAVMRAGRGVAPWILGVVKIPKADQVRLVA